MPILAPAQALLPMFFINSYGNIREVAHRIRHEPDYLPSSKGAAWGRLHEGASWTELEWWATFSEISALPGLLRWASIADAIRILSISNGEALARSAHEMRRANEDALIRALDFWHRV